MRLTTVILIASLLQVSAATFGQRITIHQSNVPIESVLKEIRKQSGYGFYYDSKTIPQKQKISISITDASLDETLKAALSGLNLKYEIEDKVVVIKKIDEPSFLDNLAGRFQTIDVRGRVVDEKGNPLTGASVSVKGGKGTTTDKDGNFFLAKVDERAVIIISFIGYLTKEINANSDLTEIKLEIGNSKLDEVQVIAYGTTSKRLSTSNISSVNAATIEKQIVDNPLLALQGRVPGITITQSTGISGSGVTVRIQGQNSLLRGNDPLYVIDGVPYAAELIPTAGNSLMGSSGYTDPNNNASIYGNPLNYINPSDIESISILKDADATSIYGSRAANGAIIISTKKGKAGETRTDFDLQTGYGEVARKLQLLNTQQYLEMRREAYRNDGLPIPTSANLPGQSNYDLTAYNQNRYTDWQNVLIGGTAKYTDIKSSISGGSNNTQFILSGNYKRQTTVFPDNFSDQKGGLHFNLNHSSNDKKFKVDFSGNYLYDVNHLPGADLTANAIRLAPNAPALYNEDGTVNWAPVEINGATKSTWTNPLSYLATKYRNQTSNLILNAVFNYQLSNVLSVRLNSGYNSMNIDELTTVPLSSIRPENRAFSQRAGVYAHSMIQVWLLEPQINYLKSFGKSSISGLVGSTLQNNNNSGSRLIGYGQESDDIISNIGASTSFEIDAVSQVVYKYDAIFGRINYNYDDKYIFNLSSRRDGSSRFGADNRFHNFWSVGSAWIFSKEKFLKEISFLSFGKLSISYGTTGNDQIGDYQYLNRATPYTVTNPYQGISALTTLELPNPHLQWEETHKLNANLDFGFLNDRILVGIDYYRNRTTNLLQSYALPSLSGYTSILTNLPAIIQNSGLEFTLATTNLKSKNFNWKTDFNITIPNNELLSYPDIETSTSNSSLIVGQPFTLTKAFNYAGVDPVTGVYQFKDKNGNITTSDQLGNDDANKYILLNTQPKFYGGLGNSFSYKNLTIDFLFQFVKQLGANYALGNQPGRFFGTADLGNQPSYVLERWQKSGDIATVQQFSNSKYSTQLNNANASIAGIGDASYIRLKNASVSYLLPANWLKKINAKRISLFMQGQNLWTITGYKGLDPETRNSLSLPPLRIITLGVRTTL